MIAGPEQEQNVPIANIELVARSFFEGVTPMILLAEGKNDEARELQEVIDRISQDKLMDLVEAKIKELRKGQKPTQPRKRRWARRYKSTPRQQMHLARAHPEDYRGLFHLPAPGPIEDRGAFDPEKNINDIHYRREPGKIHQKDFSHWWAQQLKAWGFTDTNKTQLAVRAEEAIDHLKENGVWHLAKKPPHKVTIEERKLIHDVLSSFPLKDPYASDGFTIYPNEASWTRDIYGERE